MKNFLFCLIFPILVIGCESSPSNSILVIEDKEFIFNELVSAAPAKQEDGDKKKDKGHKTCEGIPGANPFPEHTQKPCAGTPNEAPEPEIEPHVNPEYNRLPDTTWIIWIALNGNSHLISADHFNPDNYELTAIHQFSTEQEAVDFSLED